MIAHAHEKDNGMNQCAEHWLPMDIGGHVPPLLVHPTSSCARVHVRTFARSIARRPAAALGRS